MKNIKRNFKFAKTFFKSMDGVIIYEEKRRNLLRVVVYVWCLLVGFSRVLMGAHFASDVIVGILLSLILFEVISTLTYWRKA